MSFTHNVLPNHAQSEAKRRRLRKGTHSCWECKRRKMRCMFDPNSITCNGCRQRGSQCISQEFPDEPLNFIEKATGSEIGTYDKRTPKTSPIEDGRIITDHGIPTTVSASIISDPSRYLAFYKSSEVYIPKSLMNFTNCFRRLIQQPHKANCRGYLNSYMNRSPPEMIQRGYAELAATRLSSPTT